MAPEASALQTLSLMVELLMTEADDVASSSIPPPYESEMFWSMVEFETVSVPSPAIANCVAMP